MKEGDKMKTGKFYCYNPTQANFYIQNGVYPIEVGVHSYTKKPFYVFIYESSKDVYEKWMNRKHN